MGTTYKTGNEARPEFPGLMQGDMLTYANTGCAVL